MFFRPDVNFKSEEPESMRQAQIRSKRSDYDDFIGNQDGRIYQKVTDVDSNINVIFTSLFTSSGFFYNTTVSVICRST